MAATRIFVSVSSRSQYWIQASQAAETISEVALNILEKNGLLPHSTAPKFIAEERFTTRTHLIFDIFYDDYLPENGHLPGQGELPVLHIWLSKGQGADTASNQIQRMVNDRVREIHDLTGTGSVPPFFIDHSNGQTPTFWHPRTMRRAPNPPSSGEGPMEENTYEAPESGRGEAKRDN
ncbi:hypothetical protein diail_10671 [Diaporthe ilicicola]|nr:hypothetical protein diail_10671 [Diaporthe ilicicola]